jgi:hypothetical protein
MVKWKKKVNDVIYLRTEVVLASELQRCIFDNILGVLKKLLKHATPSFQITIYSIFSRHTPYDMHTDSYI